MSRPVLVKAIALHSAFVPDGVEHGLALANTRNIWLR